MKRWWPVVGKVALAYWALDLLLVAVEFKWHPLYHLARFDASLLSQMAGGHP